MHMEPGISGYCLIGRPLEESLAILSEETALIEVMDEGHHRITDPDIHRRTAEGSRLLETIFQELENAG